MQYLMLFLIALNSFALSDNMRQCMSRLFDRSGISLEQQELLRRSQGQSALDRQYRGYLQRARPAVYNKHTRAGTVTEAVNLSRRGDAQFMPGLIRERVEARALRDLPGIYQSHSGSVYKYVKFERPVGYDSGQITQWIRVEVTATGTVGEFHGHPIEPRRLLQQCPECAQLDR